VKRLTVCALLFALIASSSLALAQTTTTQNAYSWMPVFSLRGSQAATSANNAATSQVQPQAGAANTSALQEFWSLMPMFSFFNFSR